MASFTWYLIRATGITAYVLLFLTVATGMMISGPGAWWKKIPMMPLHRLLTWLMGAFLAVHVLTLLFDTFLPFNVLQILVPFTSSFEPFWTGVGVLAVYLLLFVVVSTAIRRDLHNLLWYGLHLLSYPAFVFATAHGIATGHDTRMPWMLVLYVVCAGAAATLLAVRFTKLAAGATRIARWTPGVVAGGAFGVMVVVLLISRLG